MEYKKIALVTDIPIQSLTNGSMGLDLTDEDGNIILAIQNGHIQTKYFDSSRQALPNLPPDADSYTYVLKAINGTLTWVLDTSSALDELMNETF